MAEPTISDYTDGLLKRVYTDEIRGWFLNTNAEFWMSLGEAKLEPTDIGDGFYWPFKFATGQNISTPASTGNVPDVKPATVKQGKVTLAQIVAQVELPWLLDVVGKGRGAWKSVLKEEMDAALTDSTKHLNRLYAGTHGTGRLMQVNATAATSLTAVGKLPFGTLKVRNNMKVEQYDLDTSGSIVGTAFTITKIVDSTRTITVDSVQDFTADYGLYLKGSYGNAPNGIAGLVDDGTFLTTVHNQSRSTYEELKAAVLGNSGNVRDLTEDLIVRACLNVRQKCGASVDGLLMNTGQFEKYLAFMRPDRRLNVSGGDVPGYNSGFKTGQKFYNGAVAAEILVSEDVQPRTVYGLVKDRLRRFGGTKPEWDDSTGAIFKQGVNSSGYKTTKAATLRIFSNIGNLQPNACFRIDDLSDAQLCGAGVGGTDV